MKSILMAIQPKWIEKIVSGEKTIEVRKTAPEAPFKVYMYCTKEKNENDIIWAGAFGDRGKWNGKVIGEFVCNEVEKISYVKSNIKTNNGNNYFYDIVGTCLTVTEMCNYGKGKELKGLHITALKVYDKPKELGEFRKPCNDRQNECANCAFASMFYPYPFGDGVVVGCGLNVIKPPQSYMYAETPEWATEE